MLLEHPEEDWSKFGDSGFFGCPSIINDRSYVLSYLATQTQRRPAYTNIGIRG
jgi:hypothetical protein